MQYIHGSSLYCMIHKQAGRQDETHSIFLTSQRRKVGAKRIKNLLYNPVVSFFRIYEGRLYGKCI